MSNRHKAHRRASRCLWAALCLVIASAAQAQAEPAASADHSAHHGMAPAPATSPASAPTTQGEVRKVDKAQGKLTLRHGPITHLDMPGMTMVFRVIDAKMLEEIKEGDMVRFAAERVNGAITVTAIEAVK